MAPGIPSETPAARGLWPLLSLNFFMADMQAGIGPFLGVFLMAHGWSIGPIGSVMTVGGVAGMMMTTPAGALVDATDHKRFFVVAPGIASVVASALILMSQSFVWIAASQVATAIAGAAIGPAVAGMTLGLVRQKGFPRQNGRNQAANHAGNMTGAALSGLLGWRFGFTAVVLLAALFGVLSIISVLLIPADAIDHAAARGIREGREDGNAVSGISVLARRRPLLILAAALACFHLGNGAMLPLYGMAVVAKSDAAGNGAWFVALTIIVAQGTMIVASLIAMRVSERRGYWLILLVSFLALPLRGLIAAHMITRWGVYPVQVLDGVGAGLQSVAIPGAVARILYGTGRVNVGQGAVMTVQGVGASLSPAIGGWLSQALGYSSAFLILGSFALASAALWTACGALLRPALTAPSGAEARSASDVEAAAAT